MSDEPVRAWNPLSEQPRRGWNEEPSTEKPRRRVLMWVILGINAVFVLWIGSGLMRTAESTCGGLSGVELSDCQGAEGWGKVIAIVLIIMLWALVDVILGVLWLVTRRSRP